MAKKKAAEKFFYVLENGTRYEVTGRTGKYIICGATQFRISSHRGHLVSASNLPEEPKEETEE